MKLAAVKPVSVLISRELLITVVLLWGVSLVVFAVLYSAPGNPFRNPSLTPTIGGAAVHGAASGASSWYGLYVDWFGRLLQGNLGTSLRTGLPVLGEVVRTGINTLCLTLGSLLLTLLVAVPVAVLTARRGLTAVNWSLSVFTYLVSSLPVFWLGYLVIYISIHHFDLFPLTFGDGGQRWQSFYFLLPVVVLGLGNGTLSEVVRYLREEIGRVLAEDYVSAARAKGASVWRHSFKEGFLIPITEIVAAKIPFILGGAVVVEQVFNWPGMGRMAWQAAQDRDYPLIMGITLMAAIVVRMGNFLQRVIHIVVNPRASKE